MMMDIDQALRELRAYDPDSDDFDPADFGDGIDTVHPAPAADEFDPDNFCLCAAGQHPYGRADREYCDADVDDGTGGDDDTDADSADIDLDSLPVEYAAFNRHGYERWRGR